MINKWVFKSYVALRNKYPVWNEWWTASINSSIYIWDIKTKKWILSNNDKFYEIEAEIENITNSINTITDITLDETNHRIVCDATSNNITVTLPTAIWIQWKQYIVTRIDNSSNTVTIQPQVWETIFWDTNETLIQYETLDFASDNTNYN